MKLETINRTESVKPMGWGKTVSIVLAVCLYLAVVAFLSGCANVTVVKLAELCHTNSGHPSVTFAGESGKVDCHS